LCRAREEQDEDDDDDEDEDEDEDDDDEPGTFSLLLSVLAGLTLCASSRRCEVAQLYSTMCRPPSRCPLSSSSTRRACMVDAIR